MSNEFKQVEEGITKAINEQNKRFEHLEEKIGIIIKDEIKEYLKNLQLDTLVNTIPEIDLLNNNFIESKEFENMNTQINELEASNKELKERLIILEKRFDENENNNKLYKEFEKKLQLFEENNKITADTKLNNTASDKNLEVRKDGKVVNIVINV